MTKLDDLREFIRNKNKKDEPQYKKSTEKQEFSLEVAGSDASSNPMASFGDDDTDKDLIDQLYSLPRGRVLRGEGAVWDQD